MDMGGGFSYSNIGKTSNVIERGGFVSMQEKCSQKTTRISLMLAGHFRKIRISA